MAESLEYSNYNSRNKSAMKADPSKFEPALHKFEVSPQVLESMVIMNLKNLEVESPDFSCLLDHAMATLWYIFENDGEKMMDLTKTEIAWTLRFLESIDTSSLLESSQDIDSLIRYLSAILSSRYAMEDETQFENQLESILNSLDDSMNTSQISDDYIFALSEKYESGELEIEEWEKPVAREHQERSQNASIQLQITDEDGETKNMDISDIPWQEVCKMMEKEGKNGSFEEVFQALQNQKLGSKLAPVTSTPIDKEVSDPQETNTQDENVIFYDVTSGESTEGEAENRIK